MPFHDSSTFRIDRKLLSRIFSKIHISTTQFYKSDPCWNWTASILGNYGQFKVQGIRGNKAHRILYILFVEPIPDGLVTDHLCRNTYCVNPAHIEPVTNQENQLRGIGFPGVNSRKTHCVNGHSLGIWGRIAIRKPSGFPYRVCRMCVRLNMREFRKRQKQF